MDKKGELTVPLDAGKLVVVLVVSFCFCKLIFDCNMLRAKYVTGLCCRSQSEEDMRRKIRQLERENERLEFDNTNYFFGEFAPSEIGNLNSSVPVRKSAYYCEKRSKYENVSEWHDKTPYAIAHVPVHLLNELTQQYLDLKSYGGSLKNIVDCVVREETMSCKLRKRLQSQRKSNTEMALEIGRKNIQQKTTMRKIITTLTDDVAKGMKTLSAHASNSADDNIAIGQDIYHCNSSNK